MLAFNYQLTSNYCDVFIGSRSEALETHLRQYQGEREEDRVKSDDLIAKLKQSVTGLEIRLANEQKEHVMCTCVRHSCHCSCVMMHQSLDSFQDAVD